MPTASARDSKAAKAIVDARDGGRCRRCGHECGDDFSRQHRIPRGAGGSAVLDRPSNLVTVCGSATTGCHGWMESRRTDAALLGYILPKLNPDIDPETEPLFTYDGWVLLNDQGGVEPCAAPRRYVE